MRTIGRVEYGCEGRDGVVLGDGLDICPFVSFGVETGTRRGGGHDGGGSGTRQGRVTPATTTRIGWYIGNF